MRWLEASPSPDQELEPYTQLPPRRRQFSLLLLPRSSNSLNFGYVLHTPRYFSATDLINFSQRWNDPTPRRPPNHGGGVDPELFDQLPTPSERTAFILDRFSQKCPVEIYTNELLIPGARLLKRSFFDFVVREDEANVRAWIEISKGWGVSESGLPSDSGFVFGRFRMCVQGRDSGER